MTTPTLPGHGANWLRPCSPVIVTRGTYVGLRGVVVSIADGLAMVAFGKPSILSLIALGLDDLALDLSDPTGRAHAAWWLAFSVMRQRHNQHLTASWRRSIRPDAEWELSTDGGFSVWCRENVPALDALDRYDDKRLPDGSRWVDAEALRLVCLHVAGASGV